MADPSWTPHFWRFVYGVWETVKTWNSATTFSLFKEVILLPVFVFIAAAVFQIGLSFWRPEVFRTKGAELLKALYFGIGVPLAILGLVFLVAIPFNMYYDHQGIVGTVRDLRSKNERLAQDRDEWKGKAAKTVHERQKTIVFEAGYTPRDPQTPEGKSMILTTNATITAPFQIIVRCDEKIAGYGLSILRTERGNFLTQTSERQTDDGGIVIDIGFPSFTVGTALQVNATGKQNLGYCRAEIKKI